MNDNKIIVNGTVNRTKVRQMTVSDHTEFKQSLAYLALLAAVAVSIHFDFEINLPEITTAATAFVQLNN